MGNSLAQNPRFDRVGQPAAGGGRPRPITVVGVGADGCLGLSSRAAGAVAQAQVLAGGKRHLDYFPQFQGQRVELAKDIPAALEGLAQQALENQVCILASGDPLFYGLGGLLLQKVEARLVDFIPHPSAMQWAFAKAGLSWEEAGFISLHGRPMAGLATRLRGLRRAGLFTSPENSPAAIAAHLLEYGQGGQWRVWLCQNLGGPDEQVAAMSLEELAGQQAAPLNVVLLDRLDSGWRPPAAVPFLAEEAFAVRTPLAAQITRREVRALALAALGITPDSLVWDVGAGSGSVAIEAALLAPLGQVYAVEKNPEAWPMIKANQRAHGADNLALVEGAAPEALAGLPAPDAVFVGGSGGRLGPLLEDCWRALLPGGRLAATLVTLENLAQAQQAFAMLGVEPQLRQVQLARSKTMKTSAETLTRMEAMNPVYLFSAQKPLNPSPAEAI